MARALAEDEINEETPRRDLELCILEGDRTQREEGLRAAAKARAEVSRRDHTQQLEIAMKHAGAAKDAARAARWSAMATIALVIIGVITLFRT